MIPIATAAEMKRTDERAVELGVSVETLMENAGRAVFEAIRARRPVVGETVVVLAGKGNNGGDGLVAARLLAESGAKVRVFKTADGEVPSDAALAACEQADVVVDAILGTGSRTPLEGPLADFVARVDEVARYLVSVDLPTGRSADAGPAPGPCFHPDLTVTFAATKPGLVLEPAPAEVGEVVYADIGMPESALAEIPGRVFERADVAPAIPRRARTAHKGDARLAILGGEMTGASILAAEGALGVGVGYLHLLVPGSSMPVYEIAVPEAVKVPFSGEAATEILRRAHAVVVGCGLGRSDESAEAVRKVLSATSAPVLLDGDALFVLALHKTLRRGANGEVVLTPHVGEAARLLNAKVGEIEGRRIEAAREIAEAYRATVVLKGRPTVVAPAPKASAAGPKASAAGPPSNRYFVVPFGNERLATGGAGDVLAGVLGALLCRTRCRDEEDIALRCAAGCALHGLAAEEAPNAPFGLRMRDLPREIAQQAARLVG